MKNFTENQILTNEELSQVLGGTSDTNILYENDVTNSIDCVGSGCSNPACKDSCTAGCSAGCSPGCSVASAQSTPPSKLF